jgi:uncharacterized membrane protein
MTTVQVQRVIKAPIERVWEVFTDIAGAPEAIDGIDSVDLLTDLPFGPGFRWRETRTIFGRSATEEMWVTDAQAPAHYEVAASSHGTDYLSTYTFDEVPGGVAVTLVFAGEPRSPVAKGMNLLTGWAAKGSVAKMLRQDLDDLAERCERGEPK